MYRSQAPYNDQSVINDVICARSVLVSELPESDFWSFRSSFGSENIRQQFQPDCRAVQSVVYSCVQLNQVEETQPKRSETITVSLRSLDIGIHFILFRVTAKATLLFHIRTLFVLCDGLHLFHLI